MTPEQLTEWLRFTNLRCPLCDYAIFVYEDFDACCDNPDCDWYADGKDKYRHYRADGQ